MSIVLGAVGASLKTYVVNDMSHLLEVHRIDDFIVTRLFVAVQIFGETTMPGVCVSAASRHSQLLE